MATRAKSGGNLARLFECLTPNELSKLRELDWEELCPPGDTLSAVFSNDAGLLEMQGAAPFIETLKIAHPDSATQRRYIKSETVAQFLLQNRSLFRGYLAAARDADFLRVSEYRQAHLIQVTTQIPGMDAANLAIFLATTGGDRKTILVDADTKNQFLFPLLTFDKIPEILTEHLQKPSSFRADLNNCIKPLGGNLSYLNLQATSLRAFSDEEIARILGYLDADFEQIIFYSGKLKSAWLSANANVNYAVCDSGYANELAALVRHAAGSHTVLMQATRDPYFPGLTPQFSSKRPMEAWSSAKVDLRALCDFTKQIRDATHIVIGGKENIPDQLNCYTGVGLYARYAGIDASIADQKLNNMQKKLRPLFPKSTFFSQRSIYRNLSSLPAQPVTTLLELGVNPQLVSLIKSTELRALAIFPAGILPTVTKDNLRICTCSAQGLMLFKARAARGGFSQVIAAPRTKLKKPDALAAILEQVQA